MAKRVTPRLVAAMPGKEPYTLHTSWRDGVEALVDLRPAFAKLPAFATVAGDADRFRQVEIEADPSRLVWAGGAALLVDTLWQLVREQTGQTMSAAAFRRWRETHSYTLDGAARALGLSRRMIAYYEQGSKPIPRVVALATRALDLSEAA